MNESSKTYEWVLSHVMVSRMIHMNGPCCTTNDVKRVLQFVAGTSKDNGRSKERQLVAVVCCSVLQ